MGNTLSRTSSHDPHPASLLASLHRARDRLARWLHPEHFRMADRDVNHSTVLECVHGCAGSCKTTYMLYRAVLFAIWACGCAAPPQRCLRILLLTKVGAVTSEIKTRIEEALGVSAVKMGNHYVVRLGEQSSLFRDAWSSASTRVQEVQFVISNFDAWVHLQLHHLCPSSGPGMPEGDAFRKKLEYLIQQADARECAEFVGKSADGTAQPVQYVAIDECQDIAEPYIRLVCDIQRRALQRSISPTSVFRVRVLGDRVQTVSSGGHGASDALHPIDRIQSYDYARTEHLNTNYRCPSAHIRFVNGVMRSVQRRYSIGEMLAHHTNEVDRPFLFPHLSLSGTRRFDRNTVVHKVATQLVGMVEAVFAHDPSLVPGDVAFLMRKTNDNLLFHHLLPLLNAFFREWASQNGDASAEVCEWACHLRTKIGDGRVSLSWNDLTERQCKLLSVCGDKGKQHKLVVVVGFTENSIPLKHTVNRPEELYDESHANVLLTRSTKYLCIGFAKGYPSRYLYDCNRRTPLRSLCYCAWEEPYTQFPPVYQSLVEAVHRGDDEPYHGFPSLSYNRKTAAWAPYLGPLVVHADVVSEGRVARVHDVWPSFPRTCEERAFGRRVVFKPVFERAAAARQLNVEELYCLSGELAELMLLACGRPQLFVDHMRTYHRAATGALDGAALCFTTSERRLCEARDRQRWSEFVMATFRRQGHAGRECECECECKCECECEWLVHAAFYQMTEVVRKALETVEGDGFQLHHLLFGEWWDLLLLWKELGLSTNGQSCCAERRPNLTSYKGLFAGRAVAVSSTDLAQQHHTFCANLEAFAATVLGLSPTSAHGLQTAHSVSSTVAQATTLKRLGITASHTEWRESLQFGLRGTSDLYDPVHGTLYELKASHHRGGVLRTWLLQVALYAAVEFHKTGGRESPIHAVAVVNLLEGTLWTYTLPPEARTEGASVVRRVLRVHGYSEACVAMLE